jgi:hypothetical protein
VPAFWVYGDTCGNACSGRSVFNASASSSFVNTNTDTVIYGPKDNLFGTVGATTKGRLVNDTITIAGITYDNFQFGVSDTFINSTAHIKISGVIVFDNTYTPSALAALAQPWPKPQVGILIARDTPSHDFDPSANVRNVSSVGNVSSVISIRGASATITFG